MIILKAKLWEKGISKLQKLPLCKQSNTLSDNMEFYRYREFRIWRKGHSHLPGVQVENCSGAGRRKKWKKRGKIKLASYVCSWRPHCAREEFPWAVGLVPCFPVNIPGQFQSQPPPLSRSLHFYWSFSNMVPLPGRSTWLGSLFRCPELELLASQGLHLVHMEYRSFYILLWDDTAVLRSQRISRCLDLEQDGHRVQGFHLQSNQPGPWVGLNTNPKGPDERATSLCHQSKVPREWTRVIPQQRRARNQRWQADPRSPPTPPWGYISLLPGPDATQLTGRRRDVNSRKTGHLPQGGWCQQEKGLSLVVKFIWSPSTSLWERDERSEQDEKLY